MKTVNSLSGGKTSSYLAVHYPADYNVFSLVCINDRNSKPKDSGVINYVNQKLEKFSEQFGEFVATAEDDKTLVVMMDLEQYIGKEIIWVRGMSFDDIIDKGTQTRLPSWATRYCTEKMKILPIFIWWLQNIGERVNMRIGYRANEFDRMIRFFNNSNPTNFKVPIACKTYGQKRQIFKTYNWRFCSFPLVKDNVSLLDIENYWKKNGWIGGNLFNEWRQMEFPQISNCIGCFHKKEEILAVTSEMQPEKFQWFINQEFKGMGTWLDSKITYQHIFENRFEIAKERMYEFIENGSLCDSGGCTS